MKLKNVVSIIKETIDFTPNNDGNNKKVAPITNSIGENVKYND